MLFMTEKQQRLRGVQRIWAGDVYRINGITLRHRIQIGKEMFYRIVAGKTLRLFQRAGVDRGEFIFATFVGSIDELTGDPVSSNNSEAYHKRVLSPKAGCV
ncbi:hypothetical protein D3C75_542150 [compost metagenome]